MKYPTLESVKRLWDGGGTERGKILQILLAIAFDPSRGGFEVINRFSQGVDLELCGRPVKYAVEVKCTLGDQVHIEAKDIEGLRAKESNDGYTTAVAALSINYPFKWVIGRAAYLPVGSLNIRRLERSSIPELEIIANREFEKAVEEFRDGILNPPSGLTQMSYLSDILTDESEVFSALSS